MAKPIEFDLIEDAFDDTTRIRTMTEQAPVPGMGWLVRTVVYSPHHLSTSIAFVPDKKAKAKGKLFKPLAP